MTDKDIKKDIQVFLNYRRMRHINRCNTLPTVKPIDVAQHSYYVAMLAMVLVDEYNTWAEEYNLDFHPIDFDNRFELMNSELVLRKALCHDTEESFISDIPWNVKHSDPEFHEELSKVLNQKIEEKYEGTHTMKIYRDLGFKCKSGLEGNLVNLVDMLELALYSKEEVSMGNPYMKKMLNKCIVLLESDKIYETMFKASSFFREVMRYLRGTSELNPEYIFDIN